MLMATRFSNGSAASGISGVSAMPRVLPAPRENAKPARLPVGMPVGFRLNEAHVAIFRSRVSRPCRRG